MPFLLPLLTVVAHFFLLRVERGGEGKKLTRTRRSKQEEELMMRSTVHTREMVGKGKQWGGRAQSCSSGALNGHDDGGGVHDDDGLLKTGWW